MTFKEFFQNKIGPRHLKNDGLLNTSVPHKPIADMHKVKKADGTEELKTNNKKTVILNNGEKIKELLRKHNYIATLKPGETKKLIGTSISVSLNPQGGYILTND
jgi:hypothetical protein